MTEILTADFRLFPLTESYERVLFSLPERALMYLHKQKKISR